MNQRFRFSITIQRHFYHRKSTGTIRCEGGSGNVMRVLSEIAAKCDDTALSHPLESITIRVSRIKSRKKS